MVNREPIPVYLFAGFLESGKTRFIQETLEDERFVGEERTLLLLCEEGMEEYDASSFAGENIFLETVDEAEAINPVNLTGLEKKLRPDRIIIEYNGMWKVQDLMEAMPRHWQVAQCFCFIDARTIMSYNQNMRALVVDKLTGAELVVFNRFNEADDQMPFHKLVRGVSRRAQIAYETPEGKVAYDEIEDPLPFDVNAPVIKIEDDDYALFYRDLTDEMKKYAGKKVSFKALIAKNPKLPADCMIAGRHVMTCCVEDIQYMGLVCRCADAPRFSSRDWAQLTARIDIAYHKVYGRKGPVLTVESIAPAMMPDPEVATFY